MFHDAKHKLIQLLKAAENTFWFMQACPLSLLKDVKIGYKISLIK